MNTLNQIELFEKYLAGELQENEPSLFEERLRHDPEFAGDFSAFKMLVKGLKRYGLRQQLSAHEAEIRKEEKGKFRIFTTTRILRIAAVFLVAAGISTFLYENLQTSSSTPHQLYTEYFSPYQNLAGVRGNDEHFYSQGMAAYSAGNYGDALMYLKKVSKEDSVYKDALLYSGICQLVLKNSNDAIRMFEKLEKNDEVYSQQVNWYVALAYLQSDRPKEAKNKLLKIKRGDFKYQESQELLKKLNN